MLTDATDAVVGATSFDAGITVGNESSLKQLVGVAEIEVMYDAVTECRTEYFAFLGVGNNKALRWKCFISAVQQVVAKFAQILGQIALELLHIRHLVLMSCGIVEGDIEVVEQLRACKMIASSSKLVRRLDHQNEIEKCCTGLKAKPLYRLLLFCGLTPPLLKFRFRALRAEFQVEDQ